MAAAQLTLATLLLLLIDMLAKTEKGVNTRYAPL
jgi:hypothetical protein